MAVNHNSVGSAQAATTSTITATVTVVNNPNRIAVATISWREVINGTGEGALDSVKFDGADMTFLQLAGTGPPQGNCEQYYTLAPGVGSRNCVVTWVTVSNILGIVGVEVLDNVNQASPIGQKGGNSGSNNAPTVTLAGTISGSMVTDGLSTNENTGTVTINPVAPQTERWDLRAADLSVPDRQHGNGSTNPSNGGSVTMSWTLTAARLWAICAVEIKEQPPAPTVKLGGYTSYDVGRFFIGGPESSVLPEVEAAVRRGDRRHMEKV